MTVNGTRCLLLHGVTLTLPYLRGKDNGVYTCRSAVSNTGYLRSKHSQDKVIVDGCTGNAITTRLTKKKREKKIHEKVGFQR